MSGDIIQILISIWPLLLLQFGLMIWALVDLYGRKMVRYLPKWGWVLIVILVGIFGPIIYFVMGRGEE